MRSIITFSLLVILALPLSSYATQNDFWNAPGEGFFWYQDPATKEPKKQQKRVYRDLEIMGTSEIVKEWEILKKELVEFPSKSDPELAKRIMALQKEAMERGDQAGMQMANAVQESPELGYAQEYPTSPAGRQAYHQKKIFEQVKLINANKDKIGLMLFYKSTCIYSQKFAPVLRDFSNRYGVAIVAVSVDNQPLPGFPAFRADTGQAAKLGVTKYPSLYGYIEGINRPIAIAHGVASQEEIIEGLVKLIALKEKEYKK